MARNAANAVPARPENVSKNRVAGGGSPCAGPHPEVGSGMWVLDVLGDVPGLMLATMENRSLKK